MTTMKAIAFSLMSYAARLDVVSLSMMMSAGIGGPWSLYGPTP